MSPSLSATGRYVAFASKATNLTSTTTGGHFQVFVNDATTGITTTVSQQTQSPGATTTVTLPASAATAGSSPSPRLPPTWAALNSGFVDIYVRDTSTAASCAPRSGTVTQPTTAAATRSCPPTAATSPTPRTRATWSPATPTPTRDVFRYDTTTGLTQLLSIGSTGAQGDGGSNVEAMTADGQHVAFGSAATNLVSGDTNGYNDLFVRDLG